MHPLWKHPRSKLWTWAIEKRGITSLKLCSLKGRLSLRLTQGKKRKVYEFYSSVFLLLVGVQRGQPSLNFCEWNCLLEHFWSASSTAAILKAFPGSPKPCKLHQFHTEQTLTSVSAWPNFNFRDHHCPRELRLQLHLKDQAAVCSGRARGSQAAQLIPVFSPYILPPDSGCQCRVPL